MMTGVWKNLRKAELASTRAGRRLSLLGALLSVMLLWAPDASAQGVPGSWRVAFDDSSVSFIFTPAIDLTDVVVRITGRRVDAPRHVQSFDSWTAQQPYTITAPPPPVEAEIEFRVEATGNDRRLRTIETMTVPGAERPELSLDTSMWSLDAPRIEVIHRAGFESYSVRVIGEDGSELLERQQGATSPRTVFSWEPTAVAPLLIEVRGWTPAGAWSEERLVPWSFQVEVENVLFPTASSTIPDDEIYKLDAGYERLAEVVGRVGRWVNVQLYIGGYTDTVGDSTSNQRLSEARALSLARWMRSAGVDIPIFYRGFGEQVLAVPTADGVDEERNRRAVFMLADRPPEGRNFPTTNWQRLR